LLANAGYSCELSGREFDDPLSGEDRVGRTPPLAVSEIARSDSFATVADDWRAVAVPLRFVVRLAAFRVDKTSNFMV
jgi:hypothetical protein